MLNGTNYKMPDENTSTNTDENLAPMIPMADGDEVDVAVGAVEVTTEDEGEGVDAALTATSKPDTQQMLRAPSRTPLTNIMIHQWDHPTQRQRLKPHRKDHRMVVVSEQGHTIKHPSDRKLSNLLKGAHEVGLKVYALLTMVSTGDMVDNRLLELHGGRSRNDSINFRGVKMSDL